ncbi:MAG TPA: sigma 54-interacting transcriptional regulator, partial [Syntrophomonas sp.]|nr:sigma 54-interacting transcriptional regulator [Syntrophomonas sp.]
MVFFTSTLNNRSGMTKEAWEGLLQCKKDFLNNKSNDPGQCPYLNQEIAASWIRSRQFGVDPYMDVHLPTLSPEQFEAVLEKNRQLLNIVNPLIETFKEMAILESGYVMYVCDKNGAFLHSEGEMYRIPTLHDSKKGLVWNESTIGTNVHSLCARLKQPVQIWGPEHYCTVLQDIMVSASPIMNEEGEVIATLILSQPIADEPWSESLQNFRSHTLGLITTVATAVEAQIKLENSNKKLKKSYHDLTMVNDALEATLTFVDEGIITIDRTGKILHSNYEGLKILKLRPEDVGNRNIDEFLLPQSDIKALVDADSPTDIEENILSGNDEQAFLLSLRPVMSQSDQRVEMTVLRFNPIERINSITANRAGSIASYKFEDILGESREFKMSLTLAQRFATSEENILLLGESGTGKELLAQAIHNVHRPRGPYIAVNCAAMPRELIESELFGYEGGSFTGAERNGRPGKIELANGGTLFLDEIGDMPLELQAVLLRVLEDKQVMRIGGRRYKKVDFRLVAATNKDLNKMIRESQFREDLFFRLSVLTVNIPPLRSRGSDIEMLSRTFATKYCQKQGWKIPEISPNAMKCISEYKWPGNVRQLQNAMIYAVNTALDGVIKPENLPQYIIS